jgi:hypothetical protein
LMSLAARAAYTIFGFSPFDVSRCLSSIHHFWIISF